MLATAWPSDWSRTSLSPVSWRAKRSGREWRAMGCAGVQEPLFASGADAVARADFLKRNPGVMLDTRHFDAGFTDELLAALDDVDDLTDGVAIRGDNWQALNLLDERYRRELACVYIDPPYNSKTSEILYKNTYKHSSWLSLMENRLSLSRLLAARDGSHIVAIDENEQEVLGRLLSLHFPEHNKVCVSVVHNKKGIQGRYFSYNHDFAFFCIPPSLARIAGRPVARSEWKLRQFFANGAGSRNAVLPGIASTRSMWRARRSWGSAMFVRRTSIPAFPTLRTRRRHNVSPCIRLTRRVSSGSGGMPARPSNASLTNLSFAERSPAKSRFTRPRRRWPSRPSGTTPAISPATTEPGG